MAKEASPLSESNIAANVFIPRSLLVSPDILMHILKLNNPNELNEAMITACNAFQGEANFKGGSFAFQLANDTMIKVCSYIQPSTGDGYISFTRLDGCAFEFFRAYSQSKRILFRFVNENMKMGTLQEVDALIQIAEERLHKWNNGFPLPPLRVNHF